MPARRTPGSPPPCSRSTGTTADRVALFTTTCPIFLARSSWGSAGKPRNASILPSARSSLGLGRRMGDPVDVLARIETDVAPPCWRGRRAGQTPRPNTATVFPFRSRIVRTRSVANSSKQPTWTPARTTIGVAGVERDDRAARRSSWLMSTSPGARSPSIAGVGLRAPTYCTIGEAFGAQQVLGDVLRRPGRCSAPSAIRSRVVSGGGSATAARRAAVRGDRRHDRGRSRQEAPAPDHPFSSFFSSLRNRQSVPSAMRLLRRRLDHPRLAETQGIEADGVLRIVDAPLVVRNILHGLERIVVARREAAVDEGPSGPLRLEGAEVGPFQDRPQRPLGRDRMLPDELPVTRGEAAKVLRPRPVDRAVDDDVTDLPGAQLLRVRRKPEVGVDLSLREQPLALVGGHARRSSCPCADPARRGPPCWRGRRAGSTRAR